MIPSNSFYYGQNWEFSSLFPNLESPDKTVWLMAVNTCGMLCELPSVLKSLSHCQRLGVYFLKRLVQRRFSGSTLHAPPLVVVAR
ncbi:MAG: hypothetical protein CMJ81_07495 [Planctomycetaceae bacterium]|nr:hypothetical protein [Planctomycetaceae bacterium]